MVQRHWLWIHLCAALLAPQPTGADAEADSNIADCMSDENCAKRVGRVLAEIFDNSTNGTDGNTTTTTTIGFILTNKALKLHYYEGPGEAFNQTGDFLISAMAPILGWEGYSEAASTGLPTYTFAIAIKIGLWAYANGLIYPQPKVKMNQTVQVVMADQCKDLETKTYGEKCQTPYNFRLFKDLVEGRPADAAGKNRIRPSDVVVSGFLFTAELGNVMTQSRTTSIDVASDVIEVSDKTNFPYYLRTTSPANMIHVVWTLLIRLFGYTRLDIHYCNIGNIQQLFATVADVLSAEGYKFTSVIWDPFDHTAQVPGSAQEAEYLITVFNKPGYEITAKKKAIADYNAVIMGQFNAHLHIFDMAQECAVYDIMAVIAMKGYCGGGHFWMGRDPRFAIYESSWVTAATSGIYLVMGYWSPMAKVKPFDGGLWFDASGASENEKNPEYVTFGQMIAWYGTHEAEMAEDWFYGAFPPNAYLDITTSFWRMPTLLFLVDAVIASIYTLNNVVVQHGKDFTKDQLHQALKTMDFDAPGKRIRFNNKGDGALKVIFDNYVYPKGVWDPAKGHTVDHPCGDSRFIGSFDTANAELVWTDRMLWWDLQMTPPHDKDLLCPIGQFYSRTDGICSACPAGTYSPSQGQVECTPCRAGSYSTNKSSISCKSCLEGTFSPTDGSTSCKMCAAGKYNANVQQSQCYDCNPGSYSFNGTASCTFCDVGFWQLESRKSECNICPYEKTTREVGTSSVTDCICPKGTWLTLTDRNRCEPCPTGFTCPTAADEENVPLWIFAASNPLCTDKVRCTIPVPLINYMTRMQEPLRALKCHSAVACPGGAINRCGENMDVEAVACAKCAKGFRKEGDACIKCESSDMAPTVIAPIVLVFLIIAVLWAVNRDKMMESRVSMSFGLIGTVSISALQIVSMFANLNIIWFEPMAGSIKGLGFMQLNPEILRPGCNVEASSYVIFMTRQFIPLGLAILIGFIALSKRFIFKRKIDLYVQYVNTLGTVFFALFISIISTSTGPFICYPHPDGSWSMLTDPTVMCWEGDDRHDVMVAIAVVLFIIVPIPYLASVIWATCCFRGFCLQGAVGNNRHLLAFRFLFYRYEHHAYFYGGVALIRGLLICLTPVVVATDPVFQLCIIGAIILIMGLVSNKLQPWRAPSANTIEAGLNSTLVLLIICGAANCNLSADTKSIEDFALAMCIIILICIVITGGRTALAIFKPPRVYDIGICNTASDAGSQARLVKYLMGRQGIEVMILADMDYNADNIFDLMKKAVKNMVIFLTRGCLTLPICAGQIAIGYCAGVRMVTLRSPDFVAPVEQDLVNLPGYLDASSLSLGQCAIDWAQVRKAYEYMMTEATTIAMLSLPTDWRSRYNLILDFLTAKPPHVPEQQDLRPNIVSFSVDPNDNESMAAAGIIAVRANMLTGRHFPLTDIFMIMKHHGTDTCLMAVEMSRAVIVILSRGTLQNRLQLDTVRMSLDKYVRINGTVMSQLTNRSAGKKESRKSLVGTPSGLRSSTRLKRANVFECIPIATDGFCSPSAGAFEVLFPGIDDKELANMKAFFDRMPIKLSADVVDAIVDRKVQEICVCLPSGTGDKSGGEDEADAEPPMGGVQIVGAALVEKTVKDAKITYI